MIVFLDNNGCGGHRPCAWHACLLFFLRNLIFNSYGNLSLAQKDFEGLLGLDHVGTTDNGSIGQPARNAVPASQDVHGIQSIEYGNLAGKGSLALSEAMNDGCDRCTMKGDDVLFF